MVEYLTVEEKQLPVRITYSAWKKTLSLSGDLGQMEQMESLLFFALQKGHKAEGIPFTMTEEELEDMLDEHPEILAQWNEICPRQLGDLTKKMTGGKTGTVTETPLQSLNASA